jgi:ribonuclease P protein component
LPLRASQRIRATADFDNVYKNGRRAGDALFGIAFRANEAGVVRLGMSVGARAIGNAVARNRLRRLIRESFRLRQRELPGIDIVITARPNAKTAAPDELKKSLESHWQYLIRKCAASS